MLSSHRDFKFYLHSVPDQRKLLLFDSVTFPPLYSLLLALITGIIIVNFKFCIMNMYVSNLSFHTTDEDLKTLFGQFGAVTSAKVISDRETGRSRGFAFVEMDVLAEAQEAMKKLNNKEIEGRALSVTVAKEKSTRADNKRW